jgi:hypothetical protein
MEVSLRRSGIFRLVYNQRSSTTAGRQYHEPLTTIGVDRPLFSSCCCLEVPGASCGCYYCTNSVTSHACFSNSTKPALTAYVQNLTLCFPYLRGVYNSMPCSPLVTKLPAEERQDLRVLLHGPASCGCQASGCQIAV